MGSLGRYAFPIGQLRGGKPDEGAKGRVPFALPKRPDIHAIQKQRRGDVATVFQRYYVLDERTAGGVLGRTLGIFPTSGTRALMRSARCHLCRFQLNRRASHFRIRLFHVSCSIIRVVSAKSRPFALSSAKGRALRSAARRERSARNPLPLSRLRQRSARKR
jgi:hypothetical protein